MDFPGPKISTCLAVKKNPGMLFARQKVAKKEKTSLSHSQLCHHSPGQSQEPVLRNNSWR
jgi:hypothetical protein